MSNVRETATALAATLDEMTTRIARASERLERLDATAERVERRLARGTLEGGTVVEPEATVPGKRRARATMPDPAHHAPPPLAPGRAGSPDMTGCYVGDATTTPALNAAVERLIRVKPGITRAELVKLTGCSNVNRVAGAIIHLQRHGVAIVNLGTRRLGRWAIV